METKQIGPFRGINNRLPDHALNTQDGAWLKEAVNVDIDNAGRVRRRDGVTLVQAMSNAHSVYATSDTTGFLVRSSVLYSFAFAPTYSETLLKILSVDDAVHYTPHNGSLYYSNGTDSGRVEAGVWFPWALPTTSAPVTATVGGGLPVGSYQVAVRYYNNVTGEAGGTSASTVHALTVDGSGIRVTLPGATAGATHVQVFITELNGSQVYLHSTVATGTGVFDIVALSMTSTTEEVYAEPLPACLNLFTHMGRLFGTSGSTLYYGLPYRLGYYEASDGYINFEDDIKVAVPNQFGVYVVTEKKTYWLLGDLGKVERISDPLPYGGQFGTAFALPHKKLVGWFGDKGFVVGDEQGQLVALSQDAVDATPDNSGWAFVMESRGYRRIVSNGYSINVDNNAVTTYSDYSFTSVSGYYGTRADGLYLLSGTTAAVDAYINLGKNDFGGESLKHLPACYLGVASETQMELHVTTPDEETYEYIARSCGADLRIQRVDTGRGLRANWYGLSVHNSEGSDFTLASVSFAPVASGRRI